MFSVLKGIVTNLELRNVSITGGSSVGALAGETEWLEPSPDPGPVAILSTISNVKVSGQVTGDSSVGGVIGAASNARIEQVQSFARVVGMENVGGVAGSLSDSVLSQSMAGSLVKEADENQGTNLGGLAGSVMRSTISTSMAGGDVVGKQWVGGLVGRMIEGSVFDSYAVGDVTADNQVGGLIGQADFMEIRNAYAAGKVFARTGSLVGGLVGKSNDALVQDSYWDKDTTNQNSDGSRTEAGKTTAQMQTFDPEGIFKDWDGDNIWFFYNGDYPFLPIFNPIMNLQGIDDELELEKGATEKVDDVWAMHRNEHSYDISGKYKLVSDDPNIVEVDGNNLVAKNYGTTTVHVQYHGFDQTITVTVLSPGMPDPTPYYPVSEIKFEQKDVTVNEGDDVIVLRPVITPSYATNQTVRWSSSDPDIADVDQNGRVKLGRPGVATITATTADGGKAAVIKITVVAKKTVVKLIPSERVLVVKPNQTARFTVTALYDNDEKQNITQDKQTAYESKSKDMKFRSSRIKVGSKEGTTSFTVTYQNKTITIPVIISKISVKSVAISDAPAALNVKDTQQLKLIATLSNKKTKDAAEDATWTTSDPKVVTVSDTGELEAVGAGKATITAVYGGKKTKAEVKVTASTKLDKLQISKRTLRMAPQETQQLTLTALYTDGTKADITKEATWKVADEAIANVEAGLITAKSAGTTKITVTYEEKKLTISLIVK
ncbi:Ig-like domain-containing protein [Brevibacillus fluminis]|uniref:Ig-like domain-containing protein n=1 Tax=Brevibacillus fluminis TaxID=511487 RepID=UPI003F8B89C3